MKVLIIGSGGYVSSTVLPALSGMCDISIGSKNHISAINLARQYRVEFFDLNRLLDEKFDLYFFALPTHEVSTIPRKLPVFSKIWLEKPLTDLMSESINTLVEMVDTNNFDVHCGLLKRSLLSSIPVKVESFKYKCNVPRQKNWKNLSRLGAMWVDGVHAIDLFYLINNSTFENVTINMNADYLSLSSLIGEVFIGDCGSDFLECNGIDLSKLLGYKYSRKYLKSQILDFMSGVGNFNDAILMHERFYNFLNSHK